MRLQLSCEGGSRMKAGRSASKLTYMFSGRPYFLMGFELRRTVLGHMGLSTGMLEFS